MKEGPTPFGTVRTQATVLLFLAFLAGAFAGGAIERVAMRHFRSEAATRRGGRGGPGFDGGRGGRTGLPSVFEKIGLSTEQRARIDTIVKKRSTRTDSLMKTSRAVYDSTRREIDEVLTVEQRAKLDSLRPSRRGFGPRGGPGPRPH